MLSFHTEITALFTFFCSVTLALLALSSAGGYGWTLKKLLPMDDLAPVERILFSLSLGLAVLSAVMIVAGLLHGWTPFVARAIGAAGLLFCAPFIKQVLNCRLDPSVWKNPAVVVIGLSGLWMLLLALSPITYYDSLVYHLAIPSAYVQSHRWVPLKELIYSAFPQNLEMLWTFGILVANDHLSNFLAASLSVLAALAVFSFGRRYFSTSVGLSSMAFLVAMPSFLLLSSGCYVDVGLMFYSFLSFYAIYLWLDRPRWQTLVVAGILAGFMMGIKYTGAVPMAIGAVFILGHQRKTPTQALQNVMIYSLTALVVVSPWLIKNFHYVGNPVFPFFYQWGNPKLSPWVQGAADGYFRGVAEYQPRTWLSLLRLPWDIAVRSVHFGGGMDILGDFGWMPFMLLVPCLFFCRTNSPTSRRLLGYAALFIIPWAFSRPVLRFLMPLAPILALLSGRAWTEGLRQRSAIVSWIAFPIVGSALAFGYLMFFYVAGLLSSFNVPLGLESREHYLNRKLDYYPAARYVNETPAVTRVFVLGDQRGYYYNKPVMVTPVFNQNPLVTWANEAATPEELLQTLRAQGFSHVLVNEAEMSRLESYHIFDFTPRGRANWEALRTQIGRRVYEDRACKVLAL